MPVAASAARSGFGVWAWPGAARQTPMAAPKTASSVALIFMPPQPRTRLETENFVLVLTTSRISGSGASRARRAPGSNARFVRVGVGDRPPFAQGYGDAP